MRTPRHYRRTIGMNHAIRAIYDAGSDKVYLPFDKEYSAYKKGCN